MIAVELASRHRSRAHFKQRTIERPRKSHRFRAIENRTTAFQERIKSSGVVVILPAVECRKAERLNMCIAKISRVHSPARAHLRQSARGKN